MKNLKLSICLPICTDLMSASEQLADIKDMEFDKEKNVRYQVAEMTLNVQACKLENNEMKYQREKMGGMDHLGHNTEIV